MKLESDFSGLQKIRSRLLLLLKELVVKKECERPTTFGASMESLSNETQGKVDTEIKYRKLLSEFWKIDLTFTSERERINQKRISETERINKEKESETEKLNKLYGEVKKAAKLNFENLNRNLRSKKDNDLRKINSEMQTLLNSANKKQREVNSIVEQIEKDLNSANTGYTFILSRDTSVIVDKASINLSNMDALISTTAASANAIENEIDNFKKWKEIHKKIVRWSSIIGIIVVIVLISIGKNEYDVYNLYKEGKVLYAAQHFGAAIHRFESLKIKNSLIKGNNYFREIQPLLKDSYFNLAYQYIDRENWKLANSYINKIEMDFNDDKAIQSLKKEMHYQQALEAMKSEEWDHAVAFFELVERDYKLTEKLLRECKRNIRNNNSISRRNFKPTKPKLSKSNRFQYLGPFDKQMIFKEANINSSFISFLSKNNSFRLIRKSSNGEWAKIALENGKTGWIKLYYKEKNKNKKKSIIIQKLN